MISISLGLYIGKVKPGSNLIIFLGAYLGP